MKLVYSGKTKDVLDAGQDELLLVFKDDVTGTEAGIDPGANSVIGQLEGKGAAACRLSQFFFDCLNRAGLLTHYIGPGIDDPERSLRVREARWLGLEFICRYRVYGSFFRRYARLVREGDPLPALVEVTVKDDERGDPLINDDTLAAIGVLTPSQLEQAKGLVRQASELIKAQLEQRGLELYDLKFEVGLIGNTLAIIDDISGDNMRVFDQGQAVEPLELSQRMCPTRKE